MTIKNSIFSKKSCFLNKKVIYHANDVPTFRTTTIIYMDEQPKPFLMISQKTEKLTFCVVRFYFSIFNFFEK